MIEATQLGKRYGALEALADVSFTIGQGEVVGLLGPNGAGKTTLIRILTGFFEPSSGSVSIDGIDVESNPLAAQAGIGYLPESTPLYPEMLVQEFLTMTADLRGVPRGDRRSLISEAVWATGLEQKLTQPIAELSKGFRQRVGIAQAILHKPKLLILDEPTSGLDPTQVDQVRGLIERLSQSTTVLFSTHILSEVEQVCDRAIILLDGRVRADARLDELQKTPKVIVGVAADTAASPTEVAAQLGALDLSINVRAGHHTDDQYRFEVDGAAGSTLAREVFRLARDQRWELTELRPLVRDLETVFRELVSTHTSKEAVA
jgi:ABC-2 type transport system ATP-binding protein